MMDLLNVDLNAVRNGKVKRSDKIEPLLGLNYRGVLDAATNVPVVGDVLSGGLAAYDLSQGDYGSAALNALGVLPFLSAGMIKGTGKVADVLNAKHSALDGFISESPKQITLSKIVVPKELRNQGQGTAFMNDLVSEADKVGKTVALTPSSDFGGSKARLQDFYKRFGFVPNKGKTADYEISEAMYRNPQPDAVNAPKLTEFEQRHLIAQRNAALPVEQGGLGLPPNNTAMDRAKAMGAVDAYHGTSSDVMQLDPRLFGSSTGAESAKRAWWAVDDPTTARGYAEYSANQAPVKRLLDQADRFEKKGDWDGYDNALAKAEELEATFAANPLNGQNIMPLKIIPNKPRVMDAGGAEFTDVEGGVNNFLRQAKFGGNDVAVIKNLADDVGFNGRAATHYGVLDPATVRSRFAAFDPMRRHEADLLGYADPRLLGAIAGGGLLGLGGYSLLGD